MRRSVIRFVFTFLFAFLFLMPIAKGDAILSDEITVKFNNVIINPGGVPTPIAEGREAIVIIPLAKNQVPAMAADMDVVLTDANGDDSDVVSFVKFAGGNGQILFTSDTNDVIIVPAGAKPVPELAAGNNVTNDLFPKGAGKLNVFVFSDPDGIVVPEPTSALSLLSGLVLVALGFFSASWRRHFSQQ